MILFGLALIFAYLAFREIKNPAEKRNAFSWGYITVFLSLAVLCARPAYNIWQLERMLTSKAALITDRDDVSVKCNSIMGTVFAGKGTQPLAGTAYIDTGEIFFENAYCKEFINYLGDPENASQDGVFSMHVFTHEVMHIKGERNERKLIAKQFKEITKLENCLVSIALSLLNMQYATTNRCIQTIHILASNVNQKEKWMKS